MEIKWLKKALKNIEDIAEYIALDNIDYAKTEVAKIKHSINLLKETPSLGKSGRVTGTRELITGNYIIPYRVKGNEIQIIRVFHTSQNPTKKW